MIKKLVIFGVLLCSHLMLAGQGKTVANLIYIKLLPDAANTQDSTFGLGDLNKRYGASSVERLFRDAGKYENQRRKAGLHLWLVVRFKGRANTASLAAEYGKHPSVDYAEPVYDIVRTGFINRAGQLQSSGEATPAADAPANDAMLARQWNFNNTGRIRGSIAGADIRLFEAWKTVRGAPGVTVAVIGGGIDAAHPDLSENINAEACADFVSGRTSDNYAGTPVAGIIAAAGNNKIGIAGVAGGDGVKKGVKIFSCNIAGAEPNLPAAFAHAADNGAVLCQACWHYASPGVYNRALYEALSYFCENAGKDEYGNPRRGATMLGGLVLVPAGDANADKKFYPQAFEETLTVGATNAADKKARYSNYGEVVDLTAPGGDAEQGRAGEIVTSFAGGGYNYYSGTAAACAHVTGIAALVLDRHGNAGYAPSALRCRLVSSVRQGRAADASRALSTTFPAVTGVAVSVNRLQLKEGEAHRLYAQIFPDNACAGKIVWSSNKPSTVTVSANGMLKALKEGNAEITVSVAGSNFKSICGVTVDAPPKKPVKGLALSQSKVHVNLNEEFVLKATTIPDDATDKTVEWTSSNPAAVSVDNAGKIKGLLCGGASTVIATSNDGKFTASSIVTVGKKLTGMLISNSSLTLELNEVKRLTVSPVPDEACDALFEWKSENPAVAAVDRNGNVKGVACGSTTVLASSASGVVSQCTVSVGQPVTGVSISANALNITFGEERAITATVMPAKACNKSVKWTSANAEIATVDASGKIKGVNCGKTKITVATDEGNYTAVCLVEVGKPASGIALSAASAELSINQELQLTADVIPASACNRAVSWSSSDAQTVSVSKDGRIKGTGCGKATITVMSEERNYKATCSVTVGKNVTGISLAPSSLTLSVDQSQKLVLTVLPSDACNREVSWRSDNPSVAEVSDAGVVKANFCGDATIFVTTNDGGFSGSCTVKVGAALAGIALSPARLNLLAGDESVLKASPFPEEACNREISWISSNPAVATVSETGKIKAISCGTTVVTVTTREHGFKAQCEISVGKPVNGVSLSRGFMTLVKGSEETLIAGILPDDACNSSILWVSSNPSVATVSEGRVKAIAAGKATITASAGNGRFKASCTVEVKLSSE